MGGGDRWVSETGEGENTARAQSMLKSDIVLIDWLTDFGDLTGERKSYGETTRMGYKTTQE